MKGEIVMGPINPEGVGMKREVDLLNWVPIPRVKYTRSISSKNSSILLLSSALY
jgi:hypothetical protein